MSIEKHRPALQTVLKFDAATCILMAALLILASRLVAGMTAIPAPLLFWAGMILLPVSGVMAILSLSTNVPAWAVRLVVGGNIAWVLASLLLPVFGAFSPNGLGWVFVLVQAAVVAAFAWLEWITARHPAALIGTLDI